MDSINNASPPGDKIALFRSMFAGRADVYPRRFETKDGRSGYSPVCANEWARGVCGKPKAKCHSCAARKWLPVTDDVIRRHLLGYDNEGKSFVAGVYPLLPDDTCLFLAIDFDGEGWMEDSAAFMDACREKGTPMALERSRSGNGAHVWFFFKEPVSAMLARQMGSHLLTETMEKRPSMGLSSYDRLFPSQDTMPKGGLGNLIPLPLQGVARKNKNSIFLDDEFNPYPDQWAFLAEVEKIRRGFIVSMVDKAQRGNRITGVRLVNLDEDAAAPWLLPPSRSVKIKPPGGPLPERLDVVLGDQLYFKKKELTPWLQNQIVRIAAFQNPEFYRAQAMRLPIYGISRIICCAEDYADYIALPRGCLDEVKNMLTDFGVQMNIHDERNQGSKIDLKFKGELRPEQIDAVDRLQRRDIGVLAATTAFGKTVAAAWMIARRGVNTLVVVHTRPLLEQWRERLSFFLNIPLNEIGVFGGGKKKPRGAVDVAIMQSLVRKGVVSDLVGEYGHVIFDECHHLSAPLFEAIARRVKARYVLGLSATVTRKDGQHPIIMMQCGPIRHRVDAKQQAAMRSFLHIAHVHPTGFCPPELKGGSPREHFHELYSALIDDTARNELIARHVAEAVKAGRSPIVLTERRNHLELLEQLLRPMAANVIALRGGLSARESKAVKERLLETADCPERVIVATGKFIGEGFDDPRLDTLFLALPISWRGTIAQYAGRLHREYKEKREVVIHDYADMSAPMLARMFERRCKGYDAIGYSVHIPASLEPGWPADVPLPFEEPWKNAYSVSVKRLARDGLDSPLGRLFLQAAQRFPDDLEGALRARSSSEAFLFRRLETLAATRGKFRLNDRLDIPFGGFPDMEVDLSCQEARIAIEIDGRQHLNNADAYRRDRNKDLLLQKNGWIVLRCLAEDITERLDALLDDILRLMASRTNITSEKCSWNNMVAN